MNAVRIGYFSVFEAPRKIELDAAIGLPRFAVSYDLTEVAPFATPAMAVTRDYPNILAAPRDVIAAILDTQRTILREAGDTMRIESDMQW